MKTRLLIIIGFVFSGIFLPLAHGHTIPMTKQEVLDGFDLIVLGTITDVKRTEDAAPLFTIDVEEVVKPDSFESKTVIAAGCDPNSRIAGVPCPSYEIGQRGLFLLFSSGESYDVSSESQVVEPRCTSEQFLENYQGRQSGQYLQQDGQSEWFFTGKPIDMYYVIHNRNMTEERYSVLLTAYTNGFAFSEMVNATVSQCVGLKTVTISFVPTMMGTYGYSANSEQEGIRMAEFGMAVIDYGSTPREQSNARIHAQDTWCKDGYVLVLRHDNTPKYIFDNKPSCVKPDTVSKLAERNLIELTSFYNHRPLVERVYAGMAILQFSDIPIGVMGPSKDDHILKIIIDENELNTIPNARDYFDRAIRETIPFNVPLEITFGEFWGG